VVPGASFLDCPDTQVAWRAIFSQLPTEVKLALRLSAIYHTTLCMLFIVLISAVRAATIFAVHSF
jgi:hypothetical protein